MLSLESEPVFPLLYSLKISSPAPFSFSRPEDIDAVIYRAQYDFSHNWNWQNKSLFLRSGMFSNSLTDIFRRLGISWVNMSSSQDTPQGIYNAGGLLVASCGEEAFTTPQECFEYVKSGGNTVVVLVFARPNYLSAGFLSELWGLISADSSIETVTPLMLYSGAVKGFAVNPGAPADSDTSRYTANPEVFCRISTIRNDIENYKNSGQAEPAALEGLRGEIYQLYHFEFISNIVSEVKPEDEQFFRARAYNIYTLMGQQVPEIINQPMGSVFAPAAASSSTFSSTISSDTLTFRNVIESGSSAAIESLNISVEQEDIVFSAVVSSSARHARGLDIYFDLNNKRGAGLMTFLPGLSFLFEPEDAWEFALRIENNEAALYRFGRAKPVLVQRFRASRNFSVKIPRTVLRGNPVRWGYQAVLFSRAAQNDELTLHDLLKPVASISADKLLSQPATQVPMARISAR
ncbi:MAG: hypothetical protein A2204_06895 [Elusimicrobia bacterium RIFOXYA1_FULL_47_7]|nr:MAG: hypothetical protein A2204_06895 [Elusimicrobia bacterium RIFOXYA1_FULL_47_7]